MVKYREFSESERLLMFEMKTKFGHTLEQIANHFECSPSGVKRCVDKIRIYGTARNLQRSGRKRCTTRRTDRIIKNLVLKDRKLTAIEVKDLIKTEIKDISIRTVCNRLKENRLFGGYATRKPMISEKNRLKRLQFAKKYLKMPLNFWKRVIWSDESKFEIINSKRRVRVYKRKGEGIIAQTIQPTVKHPKSVMVWGCVSSSGIGRLQKIKTRMDSKLYVNILETNLFQSAQDMGIKDNFIFQSDNDPKHTSKYTNAWIRQKDIETLEWPAQSPDLNIIEHLWEFVDRNIPSNKRKSMVIFKNAIFENWKNIPQQLIDNLVESVPKRLQAVIDANGMNTKY